MTRRLPAWLLVALLLVDVAACNSGTTQPSSSTLPPSDAGEPRRRTQNGKASWYGGKFHGRKTASGERFNQNAFTAAHRTLPFGTKVRVTNKKNGKSVQVRINDRGPYGGRAIIDLSRAAARELDMISDGIVPVRLEVLWTP